MRNGSGRRWTGYCGFRACRRSSTGRAPVSYAGGCRVGSDRRYEGRMGWWMVQGRMGWLWRCVAQPGSAPVWGTGGRGFKSRHTDWAVGSEGAGWSAGGPSTCCPTGVVGHGQAHLFRKQALAERRVGSSTLPGSSVSTEGTWMSAFHTCLLNRRSARGRAFNSPPFLFESQHGRTSGPEGNESSGAGRLLMPHDAQVSTIRRTVGP
jgi:hypothetical protein